MTTYSHTTLSQLQTILGDRLSDPSHVFWTTAELTTAVNDALHIWGAMTHYWRYTSSPISYSSGQSVTDLVYDLPGILNGTTTQPTLEMQLGPHLLEPGTSTYSGSAMFTDTAIGAALLQRVNRFLAETGIVLAQGEYLSTANVSEVDLDTTTLQLRRVAWAGNDGVQKPLHKADIRLLSGYDTDDSNTSGTPIVYLTSTEDPQVVRLYPTPTEFGTLFTAEVPNMATVTPTFSPPSTPIILVPDRFIWAIKWGAIYDLLSQDGVSSDPYRAQFCDRLWKLAIKAAEVHSTVIKAKVTSGSTTKVVPLSSVESLDQFDPNWQTVTGAIPTTIGIMQNLAYFYPVPSGTISVVWEVVRNTPTLSNGSDYIQVAREDMLPIVSLAECLCAFKMGGEDFGRTADALQQLMAAANDYNERTNATSPRRFVIDSESREDEKRRPYRISNKDN